MLELFQDQLSLLSWHGLGFTWTYLGLLGKLTWVYLGFCEFISFCSSWNYLGWFDFTWDLWVHCSLFFLRLLGNVFWMHPRLGFTWPYLGLLEITWVHRLELNWVYLWFICWRCWWNSCGLWGLPCSWPKSFCIVNSFVVSSATHGESKHQWQALLEVWGWPSIWEAGSSGSQGCYTHGTSRWLAAQGDELVDWGKGQCLVLRGFQKNQ